MPTFKTKETNPAATAKALFTTVNQEKETILTSGTYIIARLKGQIPQKNYVEVFKSTYSQGTAPSNKIFNPDTDTVFIYPNGYFGTSGTGGVLLLPPLETVAKNNEDKTQYIVSKIQSSRI